ncbi:alginate lyase family protein [Thermodesulfobacteriota bacterium]
MSNMAWKLNRLRVMSLGEIVHRIVQFFNQHYEGKKIASGWQPLPREKAKPKTYLLNFDHEIGRKWLNFFSINNEALAKLSNGEIDLLGHSPINVGNPVAWHRDPITGINIPSDLYGKSINYRDDSVVGNIKFLWELGRHQHLVPLAAAYAVSGDIKYRDAVILQIEDWINENPFGLGIHWCNTLEVALRLISWAMVHSLIYCRDKNRGLFSAVRDEEALGKSIFQQAWFVVHFLSRYSSANNHLIGELTGLWTTCQVFNLGQPGEKWADLAYKELEIEAGKQVFSDGVNKEQATYYHLWVLEYLLFAYLVGKRAQRPFSRGFTDRIHSMAEFLRKITPPGGSPPQIGDADDGFVTRFEPTWPRNPYHDVLAAEGLIFGKFQLENIPQKAFWHGLINENDIVRTLNLIEDTPNKVSYPAIFPESGYAVLGNDNCHIVFLAGPLGYPSIAAHGHADALSFCLAINDQWWLVDTGTYAYHTQPEWRNYFRGTSAHNTLVVNDKDQSKSGGPFLWIRHAYAKLEYRECAKSDKQIVNGFHDGYHNFGIIHKREISFFSTTNEIQIKDSVSGKGTHKLDLYFHFAPEIKIVRGSEPGLWEIIKEKCGIILLMIVDISWQWEVLSGRENPILGWYSPRLNKKQPTSTLKGSWTGEVPLDTITAIKCIKTSEI